MLTQFFSNTMTLSPKKTASTSITLLPPSPPASPTDAIKKSPFTKAKKTLIDIPLRLLTPIFKSLDAKSCSALAQTSRRFYVAYKSCTVAIPRAIPTYMWDTYKEIATARRMILDGDEDAEVKKMMMEHKSRLVRDRIRDDRNWDGNHPSARVVFDGRKMEQWLRIEKKLRKAERKESERVQMAIMMTLDDP